jgi:hypothetical protein
LGEIAGKVGNGVSEGHTETGDAPANKVVRLPRDWLGPRDELVPFGAETPPPVADAPPSAADFWGERSADVHDALQGPPADSAADDEPGRGAQRGPVRRDRIGWPRIRVGTMPRRRAIAVAAAGTAVVFGVALAVLSSGSPHHPSRTARLNMAAILSSGVAKIFDGGPPRIATSDTASRPRVRPIRHVVHRNKPKPPAHVAGRQPKPSPQRSIYAARTAPPRHIEVATTLQRSVSAPSPRDTTSPTAHRSTSSGASVSPTGQSGALGPVSSPNG